MGSQVQETLVAENSKTFDWSAPFANPLSFLKLFRQSRELTTFCLAGALACACEGKVVSDLNALYLIADAKFSIQKRSFWLACFGACMALAGRLCKVTLASLGTKGHTTMANFATAAAMTLLGSGTRWWQIWGCLALFPWSMERRVATSALSTYQASKGGFMGSAEYSAAFGNLRAIIVAATPLIYAKIYGWATDKAGKEAAKKGLGGLSGFLRTKLGHGSPYFFGALMALLAELLLRTLKKADWEGKKKEATASGGGPVTDGKSKNK